MKLCCFSFRVNQTRTCVLVVRNKELRVVVVVVRSTLHVTVIRVTTSNEKCEKEKEAGYGK